MTDFRALCARMADQLDICYRLQMHDARQASRSKLRAIADELEQEVQ
jgi:hypothetical protein